MSTPDKAVLHERRLQAIRDRILSTVSLGIEDVARHLGVSRSTVESYPVEITRCFDSTPASSRRRMRFSPAEVEAIKVRLRRWERARGRGEGEAYLRSLREEMEREEDDVLRAADESRRILTGEAA